jgi:hypothetical protein
VITWRKLTNDRDRKPKKNLEVSEFVSVSIEAIKISFLYFLQQANQKVKKPLAHVEKVPI